MNVQVEAACQPIQVIVTGPPPSVKAPGIFITRWGKAVPTAHVPVLYMVLDLEQTKKLPLCTAMGNGSEVDEVLKRLVPTM